MPARRRVSHAAAADRNYSVRRRKSEAAAADHGSVLQPSAQNIVYLRD
jgi:hypothetical protein